MLKRKKLKPRNPNNTQGGYKVSWGLHCSVEEKVLVPERKSALVHGREFPHDVLHIPITSSHRDLGKWLLQCYRTHYKDFYFLGAVLYWPEWKLIQCRAHRPTFSKKQLCKSHCTVKKNNIVNVSSNKPLRHTCKSLIKPSKVSFKSFLRLIVLFYLDEKISKLHFGVKTLMNMAHCAVTQPLSCTPRLQWSDLTTTLHTGNPPSIACHHVSYVHVITVSQQHCTLCIATVLSFTVAIHGV